MRKFWHGMLWGGLVAASIIGSMIMKKPQRKPFIVRSADMMKDKTHEWVTQARKTRKRMLKKMF